MQIFYQFITVTLYFCQKLDFSEPEGFIILYELYQRKFSLNKFCIFTPTVKQICLFIGAILKMQIVCVVLFVVKAKVNQM